MLKIERNQKKIPTKKGPIETTPIVLKRGTKEKKGKKQVEEEFSRKKDDII